MGILSYGYKGSKTPAGKKVIEKIKNVFTGGKQKTYGTGAIKSVKTNVPKTPVEKSLRDLNIQIQKGKAQTSKLEQTLWEVKHKKREERFTFAYDRGNVAKKSKKKD